MSVFKLFQDSFLENILEFFVRGVKLFRSSLCVSVNCKLETVNWKLETMFNVQCKAYCFHDATSE